MQSKVKDVSDYIDSVSEPQRNAVIKLRKVILENLPKGFQECMNYGMIGYVVPHKLYPKGYHCNPELPLPFLSMAAQKNFIALYHMGIYLDAALYDWFVKAYEKLNIGKLDMGKSCIRFKKPDKIPFELIGELVSKMSTKNWIKLYEKTLNKQSS